MKFDYIKTSAIMCGWDADHRISKGWEVLRMKKDNDKIWNYMIEHKLEAHHFKVYDYNLNSNKHVQTFLSLKDLEEYVLTLL